MRGTATHTALVLLLAGGGAAQPVAERDAPLPLFDYYEGDLLPEGAVGMVIVNNEVRSAMPGWQESVVETPHGPLVLRHLETQNSLCDVPCPDYVEVVLPPPGMRAEPLELEIAEGEAGMIHLLPYLGF